MKKHEFLDQLHKALSGLPPKEIDEQLIYYSEMIDDKMEEGISEEEAVAQIGPIEEIAAQFKTELPRKDTLKEAIFKNYSLPLWAIICLIIGIPVWGSLLIGAICVAAAILSTIFAGIIALWAVSVAIGGCAIGAVVLAVMQFIHGQAATAICLLGGALVCMGLTILLVLSSKAVTKCILWCIKRIISEIRNFIAKRRRS
ncbi:MAG: DUF1700 domain-containing protein [Oscillospiraceae bacterium]|nr:DUF1700 domain-containing protein [Oscillospiraceae bacterium]